MNEAPGAGEATGSATLHLRGVEKRYGLRQVLRGVSLEVQAGEIVALVGENGTGKSTLVRCIAGVNGPDGADAGAVELDGLPLRAHRVNGPAPSVAVVWQDLALCDNLSAVANVFLGGERVGRVLLDESAMLAETHHLFELLRIAIPQPQLPVRLLSGGQRQLVAIARAVRQRPPVLILDEPTASLGVTETMVVERLLDQLRALGTAILLVSHGLEQVFRLADRIAVLREGVIVANVSPLEVHPDDVVAHMSGVEADSTARRQLRRLRSLVDQLAEVEPAASLPLIVSAMAEAVGIDQLCVHLLDAPDAEGRILLRCSAAVGLDGAFLEDLQLLPIGPGGGPPGVAAANGEVVVAEDLRRESRWRLFNHGESPMPRSCWSVPVLGSSAVLGAVSGFAETVGRPQADQLELVTLYASHAAAAIERERLLAEATRRNRVLETLRGVLDTLAGPLPAYGGLAVALHALCRGLGADAVAIHPARGEHPAVTPLDVHGEQPVDDGVREAAAQRQAAAADAMLSLPPSVEGAKAIDADILAVRIEAPNGWAVVTAWWSVPGRRTQDSADLLADAARSLRFALERQMAERANAEAASLRRSQSRQREFLFRLNHELRTPLTAIQGFASTLRQPDVQWDVESQQRFLDSIATESGRMGRLVADLLDFSAIDSGTLRLQQDWCDVGLVLEAARRCVTDAPGSLFHLDVAGMPPVWADHDRLEQVFVNLFENAARHAQGLTAVTVTARPAGDGTQIEVRVADDGKGLGCDPTELERVFLPHERGRTDGPGAGLGLAIVRGVIEAHGGRVGLAPVPVGTIVVVTLPVEPQAGPPAPASVSAADGSTSGAAVGGAAVSGAAVKTGPSVGEAVRQMPQVEIPALGARP